MSDEANRSEPVVTHYKRMLAWSERLLREDILKLAIREFQFQDHPPRVMASFGTRDLSAMGVVNHYRWVEAIQADIERWRAELAKAKEPIKL